MKLPATKAVSKLEFSISPIDKPITPPIKAVRFTVPLQITACKLVNFYVNRIDVSPIS